MSTSVQHITISSEDAGQRLDNFLIRILKGAPKSLIYRVIRKGEVRLNKGRAKPDRKLSEGDIVRVPPMRLADPKEPVKPGERLTKLLDDAILLETPDYLVVNKPVGLAVHGGSGVNLGLIEALRQMRPLEKSLELVHRLDRETSGCILVAKKRSVLKYLQSLFRGEKQIRKVYFALVVGVWSKRRQVVDAPLRKNELQSGERIVKVTPDGKPSRTEFEIEESFGDQATLLRVEPVTGRTHQIRVHARHAGHPLIGDDKYGDDEANKVMKKQGFKRLFLHAASLRFTDSHGEAIDVQAPLPEDLEQGLKNLRKGL